MSISICPEVSQREEPKLLSQHGAVVPLRRLHLFPVIQVASDQTCASMWLFLLQTDFAMQRQRGALAINNGRAVPLRGKVQ